MNKTARIRELNDEYRKHGIGAGRTMMTSGVASMGQAFVAEVLKRVREFDTFNRDNDPHKEHDFGGIEVQGNTVFFKFDYYDRSLTSGSPDPSDPLCTCRVLTIMLAEEY